MTPHVQNFGQFRSLSFRVIQVFTGELPFPGLSESEVEESVLQGKRPTRPIHPAVIDPVWELMQRCWSEDPKARPTAEVVLQDLKSIIDRNSKLQPLPPAVVSPLLESILKFLDDDPKDRPTAERFVQDLKSTIDINDNLPGPNADEAGEVLESAVSGDNEPAATVSSED